MDRADLPARISDVAALDRPHRRDLYALLARAHPVVCGMNLDLLTGLAGALDARDRLAPRLRPEPGLCCVRLAAR